MNRKRYHLLVIIASIGFAVLTAGLVVSLPAVMASNKPIAQLPILDSHAEATIPLAGMENNAPRQTGPLPDSTLTQTVVLPPISTQNGMLPPDMVESVEGGATRQDVALISQQNAHGGQPSNAAAPTQIEAGEFTSLNGAVCAYNNFTDTLAAAVDGDVVYINQGAWVGRIGKVNKDLTFVAASNNCTQIATSGVTIDGNDNAVDIGGVIEVTATKRVTLSYLTLTNGTAISGGIAAVNYDASLILDHSHLTAGYAEIGGGVFMNGGNLIMNESSVFSNTAETYGGGIYGTAGANVIVQNNSLVTSNLVSNFLGMGGGIYLTGNEGSITVTASTIMSNTASYAGGIRLIGDNKLWLLDQAEMKYNQSVDGWGGAILSSAGKVIIEDANLEKNTSGAEGGAIWAGDSTVSISNSSVFDNESGNYGGGIFIGDDSIVDISNSQVISNETAYWGGGVYVSAYNLVNIEGNSHIDKNKTSDATGIGGGMYISGDNSQITITASTVMSNVAPLSGGGIRLNGVSTLRLLDGTQVSANQIPGAGGGLAASNGTVIIDGVSFNKNSANGNGGAIWLDSGDLTVTDANLTNNHSGDSGGGIFRSGGDLALYAISQSTDVSNNDATTEGGGIFDESGLPLIFQAINGWPVEIVGNSANYGGGVYITNETILQGSGDIDFLENIATISGGGIFVADLAAIYLDASSLSAAPDFLSNQATYERGGAIFALKSAGVSLSGARIGSPANGNSAPNDRGGGLFFQSSPLTLTNVTLNDNQAKGHGGAMALYSSTLLMETIFPYSPALNEGISELSALPISCNPDLLGADQYCSQFSNNTSSTGNGGALFLEDTIASINHTAFMDNDANSGAALYIYRSRLSLNQARVSENTSNSVITPTIIQVDGGSSGGVTAYLTATQITIADNFGTAIDLSPFTAGVFNNNIVWGNESRGGILPYATASCNNTQERSLGGSNISQDPLFLETSRGMYHLPLYSPSVDTCAGNSYFDLDGYSRPQGVAYDMGAFEAMAPTLFLSVILR